MEYFPLGLKAAHIGVVGLGLYVAIEGQNKLEATGTGNPTPISPDNHLYGFIKEQFLYATYVVTLIALAQLFVLFYYHNYGGKEAYFRGAFFVLALINIIFASIVLQGAVTLLKTDSAYTDGSGNAGTVNSLTGDKKTVSIAAAVLGGLVITFSFINFYHAGAGANRAEAGSMGRRSPRRK